MGAPHSLAKEGTSHPHVHLEVVFVDGSAPSQSLGAEDSALVDLIDDGAVVFVDSSPGVGDMVGSARPDISHSCR